MADVRSSIKQDGGSARACRSASLGHPGSALTRKSASQGHPSGTTQVESGVGFAPDSATVEPRPHVARLVLKRGTGLSVPLASLQHVVWKGKGELAHLPWVTGVQRAVVLVDRWGGFSGSVLALLSLDISVFAVSLDANVAAIKVATANLANLLHGGTVESFSRCVLPDFW